MNLTSCSFLLTVLLVFCFVGCKPDNGLVPVRGRVFIGEALSTQGKGHVTFHPDDKKGNKALEEGVGEILADGSFLLQTRGQVGIAPGWYKVAVGIAEVPDPANPYVTKWLMPEPEKYQDWNRSGIEIEVVADPQAAKDRYDIKLPPLK